MSQPSRTDLESIGRFSRRSGIPVSHLRHYHEVGLLQPACIDPESGYRYYAIAQSEAAEVIGILRSIDVPVRDIQRLLADPAQANVREVLAAHRTRNRASKVAPVNSCGTSRARCRFSSRTERQPTSMGLVVSLSSKSTRVRRIGITTTNLARRG